MPKSLPVTVDVTNLPLFKVLFAATHRVLLERLVPPHKISIQAWNELIAAHDAVAKIREDAE